MIETSPGGLVFIRSTTAVIRHTYRLGPGLPVLATSADTNQRFNPRTVIVEVATAPGTPILTVIIDGQQVVATRTGIVETSHPVRATYTASLPGGGHRSLADLPDWIRPILDDATARAREAWA